ncbi:MAG: hypothetical protein AB1351_07965 [Thermoproteota archaeon]
MAAATNRPVGKKVKCSSCGYELVGVEYFEGNLKESPTRHVRFFCPRCKFVNPVV